MENKEYVNISVENIYPHPENPRKNLGDLSELVESIKKQGVMQNLTVIPGHWLEDGGWSDGAYTLIIGHRRCAAAKLAGVTEVPCRIVEDMSKKDQVSIMLEENMQRNDLTIYEQAQGFQMMLDLGETEETIAEKTGFSKTTIRRRLNIAKLDQEELQKKEKDDSFQLTLKDLYELEKIDDLETRNKILREANSSRDIIWKAQNAVAEAKREKVAKAIIEKLEEKGIKVAPENASSEIYSGKWDRVKSYSLEEDIPEEIKCKAKKDDVLYYLKHFREIVIIKKAKKKESTPEDLARKEKEKKRKEIIAIVKEMDARRKDFIENIINGKIDAVKETDEIKDELWKVLVSLGTHLSKSYMRKFFTCKEDYKCTPEEKEEADKKVDNCSVLHQMMLQLHYGMDSAGTIVDWQGMYNKTNGDELLEGYAILEKYGWSFNDEEKQILDGTHELYKHKEDTEK